MKKIIYTLILPLVVVGGLVFANREVENRGFKKPTPKPLSAAESKTEKEKWEATPEGTKYKQWTISPKGKKVLTSAAKLKKPISAFISMEAIVTSLSLPPGSRLGFGMMVKIDGEEYILSFGPEKPVNNFINFNHAFNQLHALKVNDRIFIKSHTVLHAPKYSYAIISGDYVERDNKIIYQRVPNKNGC